MGIDRKILFAFDLDGTVLANSTTSEIHPITIEAINRARNEGHIVCLLTGRPWRATKAIYEMLKLDTVVVNYNGAYIHNPNSDSGFIPTLRYLELNDVLYILGNNKLKYSMENLAIEGPDWVRLHKKSEILEKVFSFQLAKDLRIGIDFTKIPLKPTGVVIDLKNNIDANNLRHYLRRRYGDLCEFTTWSKGKNETKVLDITGLNAKKDKALILLSRYYDVNINNIIAFGDAHNDIEMLQIAGISVSMLNADDEVKKITKYTTDHDNENGGVGHFVNKILDNFDFYWDQMMERIRQDEIVNKFDLE